MNFTLVGALSTGKISKVTPISLDKASNFHSVISMGADKKDPGSIHEELVKLSHSIQSGKDISAKELLFYQIKAGQFGLQVELLSKVGESLSSTVRKLEQGH